MLWPFSVHFVVIVPQLWLPTSHTMHYNSIINTLLNTDISKMLSQQQFSLLPLPWQLSNSVTFRCLLDKWSLCIHTAEIFTYDNSYKEKRTEQDYIYRVKTTIKLQLINRQYNDIKTPQKHSSTSRLWTQFPRARLWYWETKPRMTEINTKNPDNQMAQKSSYPG